MCLFILPPKEYTNTCFLLNIVHLLCEVINNSDFYLPFPYFMLSFSQKAVSSSSIITSTTKF